MTELLVEEGELEVWECHACLRTILDIVLVVVAAESLDGLKRATQLDAEKFCAMEAVAILVGQRGSSAKVTSGIGSLELSIHGIALRWCQVDGGVESQGIFFVFCQSHVGGHDGSQTSQIGIRVLDIALTIE